MAQIQEVVLTCDLCSGDKPGTGTFAFSTEGRSYEIDLCDRHTKQFRDQLGAFATAGRRVGSAARGRRSSAGGSSRERAAAIRAWARARGIPVSQRGRISADVAAQYDARGGR